MEWLTHLLALLVGAAGGFTIGITVNVKSSKKTDQSTTHTTQRDIKAGGSVAGRDVIERSNDE